MLKIKNLNKKFSKKYILKDLNLELNNGQILGLLGPNGCGKTTLMKIIMNLSQKDSGEVYINGEKLSDKTNSYISFLPDVPFMENNLTIEKALEFYKFFYDDFNEAKADKLLNKLDLNKKQKLSSLSKGMLEKVHLTFVLSRNAKIYILDEPIAGVDIVTRKEILKLIIENISEDSIVILTTHLIKDIEQIFDKVCFLKDGSIDKIYDVEELRINENKSVEDLYIDYFGGDLNA